MARARNIKPGFFESEDPAKVGFAQRLLWIALWTLADREGWLEDRPAQIRKYAFGFDEEVTAAQVDQWLADLHKAQLIHRQQFDGKKLVYILKFKKHQRPHPNEGPSTLKPPHFDPDSDLGSKHFIPKSECLQPRLEARGLNEECGMRNVDVLNADRTNAAPAPKALPPPAAQPSLLDADPQAEFKRLAGELVQLLPAAGDVNLTARQLEIEYSSSASFADDPLAFADSVMASAKRWRKAWDQNPALRPKAAQWWLKDGDHARRPPEPAAAKPTGMKRLIDYFPEVKDASE